MPYEIKNIQSLNIKYNVINLENGILDVQIGFEVLGGKGGRIYITGLKGDDWDFQEHINEHSDCIRIIDQNIETGSQLEYGRYKVEFWYHNELHRSYFADSYKK